MTALFMYRTSVAVRYLNYELRYQAAKRIGSDRVDSITASLMQYGELIPITKINIHWPPPHPREAWLTGMVTQNVLNSLRGTGGFAE